MLLIAISAPVISVNLPTRLAVARLEYESQRAHEFRIVWKYLRGSTGDELIVHNYLGRNVGFDYRKCYPALVSSRAEEGWTLPVGVDLRRCT